MDITENYFRVNYLSEMFAREQGQYIAGSSLPHIEHLQLLVFSLLLVTNKPHFKRVIDWKLITNGIKKHVSFLKLSHQEAGDIEKLNIQKHTEDALHPTP